MKVLETVHKRLPRCVYVLYEQQLRCEMLLNKSFLRNFRHIDYGAGMTFRRSNAAFSRDSL